MAEKLLKDGRTKFVDRVNSTVLKDLIDDLLDEHIFSNAEAESVTEGNPITRDKARNLIDMVIKKGRNACESLSTSINNRDHHLSTSMGLDVQRGEAAISTQETCSPMVENGITLCPQEVYNKIKKDEAGQLSNTSNSSIKMLAFSAGAAFVVLGIYRREILANIILDFFHYYF